MKKTPRVIIPAGSQSVEREYARLIMKYQRLYAQLVRAGLATLLPGLREVVTEESPSAVAARVRMDAAVDEDLDRLFSSIQDKLEKAMPDAVLRKWAKAMIGKTHKLSADNQAKHIKKATEPHPEGPMEIRGLLGPDKKLNPYFNTVIDQNIGLIRSIPERSIPTFKNALVSALTGDMNVKEIQNLIQKKLGITASAAQLIARDQVGKVNGALDQYHQEVIGVKRYRWRTMHDGAVRGNPAGEYPPRPGQNNHWKLDGKIFSWSNPPLMADGRRLHPKQDYQCRCYAEAVIDDII